MPGPWSSSGVPPSRGKVVCRCIMLVILAIVVILGLIILITWLIIRPRELVYSMDDAKVHGFDLYKNNHVNGSFDLVMKANNKNRRVSIYYDSIEITVFYNAQTIAFATMEPFFQPRRNVTRLEVKPVAQNVPLARSVAKDLRVEKSAGVVEFEVRMKASIRYKVGLWKSSHYTLRVLCVPEVHMDPSRAFERVHCDVDT